MSKMNALARYIVDREQSADSTCSRSTRELGYGATSPAVAFLTPQMRLLSTIFFTRPFSSIRRQRRRTLYWSRFLTQEPKQCKIRALYAARRLCQPWGFQQKQLIESHHIVGLSGQRHSTGVWKSNTLQILMQESLLRAI